MKSLVLSLVLLAGGKMSAQRSFDVLHYTNSLELTDRSDTIYGSTVIDIFIVSPTDQISIDLKNTGTDGKGMLLRDAGYMTGHQYRKTYERKGDKILFYGSFNKGDTAKLSIVYEGIPANGLIISRNKFGKRTFFGDNWPNRAHHWLPCVDDPADKASVEFMITAPAHYQVVSNGVLVEETNLPGDKKLTYWKEEVPLPTKVMVIGVAEFAVQNNGSVNGCIPVSSWVFPENKGNGFYDYATARDVLAWHINYTGPYAYQKLANVQSKTMFGGMENASAIFYYEESVTGNRAEEELQSHEIVHQWFGNSATEKSFAHVWLSEGFATYLTHLYMESRYGADVLAPRMKADRDAVLEFVRHNKRPVVDTTSDYMRLLNANSYQKGGWVLHMLRRQLGDSVFHKSIRDYYALFGGKNADTRDLQKVFEKNAGKNLDRFFDQWLYTPENPELDITWSWDSKTKKLLLKVVQLQQKIFQFPLEIGMITASGVNVPAKTQIEKRETLVSFSMAEMPVSVVADPFTSLLFSGNVKKQP